MSYYPIDPHNPSDALGQKILPNDYVIYFTGDSSSVSGTIARIVRINDKPKGAGYSGQHTYTLTLEPIFDGSTYGYAWPKKEVPDPLFAKIGYDHRKRDPVTGVSPKTVTYPGFKEVFDEDGKRKTVTLQRIQNVVKIDKNQAVALEQQNIQEFNMRTEGTR